VYNTIWKGTGDLGYTRMTALITADGKSKANGTKTLNLAAKHMLNIGNYVLSKNRSKVL
jgi:hypothetical protein